MQLKLTNMINLNFQMAAQKIFTNLFCVFSAL